MAQITNEIIGGIEVLPSDGELEIYFSTSE